MCWDMPTPIRIASVRHTAGLSMSRRMSGKGFVGLGVGRSLYTSLFAILQLQGFYRALAGITLPNPGSVGLHQAMGFQPLGTYQNIGYKCGQWHDVSGFSLRFATAPACPTIRSISRSSVNCRSGANDWRLGLP